MIVKAALNLSESGESVTVFANDTDIIIMMMHIWKDEVRTALVWSEYKSGGHQIKQLNVQTAVSTLSDQVASYLLFVIHVFGGCDTTSSIYEKRKASILQLVQKSKRTRTLCDIFMKTFFFQGQIVEAGIKLFLLMFN